MVYVPTGTEVSREQNEQSLRKALAKRKRSEEEAERFRQKAIEKAAKMWAAAAGDEDNPTIVGDLPACTNGRGTNHPRAIGYLAARGVAVADLPGGKLPSTIRYLGKAEHRIKATHPDGREEWLTHDGPALLFAGHDVNKVLRGVQRIYIDHAGADAKASRPAALPEGEPFDPKKMIGSLTGAACRLSPIKHGTLVLCEGPETAVALAAAVGDKAAVWCLFSTSGLKSVELPEAWLNEQSGLLTRVVVAADRDTVKRGKCAGLDAATACVERIVSLAPHLDVSISAPSKDVAPDLFGDDGEPVGKGVDWLDVYVSAGKKAVADAVLGAKTIGAPRQEGSGGDVGGFLGTLAGGDGRLIPEGDLPMARTMMLDFEEFSSQNKRAGSGWKYVRWSECWWRYRGGDRPCYTKVTEETLRSRAWPILQSYQKMGRYEAEPLNPSRKTVENVVAAMMVDCSVDVDDAPAMLEPSFRDDGSPVWGYRSVDTDFQGVNLLPCTNGILDVASLIAGKVVLHPHTPKFFSASCRPFGVDADELQRLLGMTRKEQDHYLAKSGKCPTWLKFLGDVSAGDNDPDAWIDLLQRWMGLCLTPDVSPEKILLLVGPPGGGKSTVLDAIAAIVGDDAVTTTTLSRVAERFGFVSLVGKNVTILSDAGAGRWTDLGQALEVLKMISGRDPVTVEYKGKNEMPTVRLTCKVCIATNDLPKLPDTSGALHRRLLPLRFSTSFANKVDVRVKENVVAEASGVFLWALLGLVRLRKSGNSFVLPASGHETLTEIREVNEPIYAFVADRCVCASDRDKAQAMSVYAEDLRKAYVQWCELQDYEPLHSQKFAKSLCSAFPLIARKQETTGERKRYYVGIELRSADPVSSFYAADTSEEAQSPAESEQGGEEMPF